MPSSQLSMVAQVGDVPLGSRAECEFSRRVARQCFGAWKPLHGRLLVVHGNLTQRATIAFAPLGVTSPSPPHYRPSQIVSPWRLGISPHDALVVVPRKTFVGRLRGALEYVCVLQRRVKAWLEHSHAQTHGGPSGLMSVSTHGRAVICGYHLCGFCDSGASCLSDQPRSGYVALASASSEAGSD